MFNQTQLGGTSRGAVQWVCLYYEPALTMGLLDREPIGQSWLKYKALPPPPHSSPQDSDDPAPPPHSSPQDSDERAAAYIAGAAPCRWGPFGSFEPLGPHPDGDNIKVCVRVCGYGCGGGGRVLYSVGVVRVV